jgi:hypothetical protein
MKKARSAVRLIWLFEFCGRGERIRTSGLYVPNVALYRAKLHPDVFEISAVRNLGKA